MPRPQRSPLMSFSDPSTWEQMFQELIQEEKPRAKWTLQLDKNILPDHLTMGWRQYQQSGVGRWVGVGQIVSPPEGPTQRRILPLPICSYKKKGGGGEQMWLGGSPSLLWLRGWLGAPRGQPSTLFNAGSLSVLPGLLTIIVLESVKSTSKFFPNCSNLLSFYWISS